MSRRQQAIEAMSEALHSDACTDDEHEWCDWGNWVREAEIALDAALAVLQPVVPNTGEALGALPVGSVIRGVPTRPWGPGCAIPPSSVNERFPRCWLDVRGDEGNGTNDLVHEADRYGITGWTVLHWGDETRNTAGSRGEPPRAASGIGGVHEEGPAPARPANPKPESEETR